MKFQADIVGAKLEGSEKPKVKQEPFKFGSPDDYAHMSKTEKEALTKKMMGGHKSMKTFGGVKVDG